MKILVTGATGFIGGHIISALIEKGYEIIGISRKIDDKEYDGGKLTYLRIDVADKDELNKLDNFRIDAVINCLGILGRFGLSDNIYIKTNVQTTKNLLDFAKTKGIKHFMHISSCGVVGPIDSDKCPADENYPGKPSNIYEKSKWIAEEEVKKSSINYTIIRPEFVYGPRDLHVLGLFKAINNGKFILIDSGKSYLHPTYIDDVIFGVTQTIFNQNSYGKIFNIVGERYVPVKELANIISNKLNNKTNFKDVPSSILMPMARIMEYSHLLTNPPLTTSQVKFFTEYRAFTYQNAKNTIGYMPTVTLDEGIERTIRWYLQNGYIRYNFGVSNLNIYNLYETAALEREGWGTAYEYYSKLPYLNKSFENEKIIDVMILGLPEKYGYSMDFILYCYLNNVKRIIVFDERKEKIDNFSKLLIDIKKNISKRIGMIPDIEIHKIYSWNDLKNYNVDMTLSCEVFQRLDDISKDTFLDFIRNNTRKYLIFVPNGNNVAHKNVSTLKTSSIDELTDIFKDTEITDFGYVDCPPNPPGIILNKNKNNNKNISADKEDNSIIDKLMGIVIYRLLSIWYIIFEQKISFLLKNFFRSNAHIVFVIGKNNK